MTRKKKLRNTTKKNNKFFLFETIIEREISSNQMMYDKLFVVHFLLNKTKHKPTTAMGNAKWHSID